MKVTKLILSGYKRLMLNNIQHITLTPTSVYQLILGTNGSGKSSILEELSPLPSNSKHYIKGGYKKIYVTHQNIDYVLTSIFKSGSGSHSFIRYNGSESEELNPGGTGQIQKSLVEQIFGITPQIHQLLVGKTKFTSLSPAKRREWITMICSADYTYALGVYQKLRSGARDAQGALKHTKQRLYNETAKLEQLEDVKGLEDRYQRLHQELSVLFGEQQRMSMTLDQLNKRYQTVMSQLDECARDVMDKGEYLRGENQQLGFADLTQAQEALQQNLTEQEVNKSLRQQLGKEYQELSDLIQGMKANNVEDAGSLKEQIAQIHSERASVRQKLATYPTLQAEAKAARRSIYEASGAITTALKQLPPNKDRTFTRDRVTQANQDKELVERKVERNRNNIASLERRLQHLESLKEEECPKCHHVWVPGKSDQDVAKYRHFIAQETKEMEANKEALDELVKYLDKAEDYRFAFNTFRTITQEYPRLVDLWDRLLNDSRLMSDPSALVGLVNTFSREVEYHVSLEELQEREERLETLLKSASGNEGGAAGLEKRLTTLQQQLQEIGVTLKQLHRDEMILKDFVRDTTRYLKRVEQLDDLLAEVQELYDNMVEGERQHILTETIQSHQNELAGVQSRRSEKQTLEGVIADLQRDHDQLTVDQKALALLAASLSPTDGLIAEQLVGFIKNFVDHVNRFIGSVWTYELNVKPCGVDGGDLDYKFPFTVNDGQGTLAVSDISEGSEAQLEIINLAFRLVTMIYLKLEEYPLYLDELGRSFDEQHRRNVMDFIKRLADGGNYTQLFMVSHFAAEYGAFTQAEVLVLSDANIAVPLHHNEHAIIE